MKAKEIVTKSSKELDQYILDQRRALQDAHVELRTKEVTNVKTIAKIKRNLARALTVQRQMQINANQKEASNE